MRREERVTVQGPVKKQPSDGMSHGRGGATLPMTSEGCRIADREPRGGGAAVDMPGRQDPPAHPPTEPLKPPKGLPNRHGQFQIFARNLGADRSKARETFPGQWNEATFAFHSMHVLSTMLQVHVGPGRCLRAIGDVSVGPGSNGGHQPVGTVPPRSVQ